MLVRSRIPLLLLLAASSCAKPGARSAGCTAPQSRSEWALSAQAGRLEGIALSEQEKLPVGNVEVVLDDTRRQRTGTDGRFVFTGVPEGRHVLATSPAVYRTHVDTISLLPSGGATGTLYLALRESVLEGCVLYKP